MIEKKFKIEDFLKRWKEKFMKKIKSEELRCDPQVWTSGKNFRNYFKHFHDLNLIMDYENIQEKGDYKYALWVAIKEQDFMIKICSKVKNKCTIALKTIEDHMEMGSFILNTFLFLFTVQN